MSKTKQTISLAIIAKNEGKGLEKAILSCRDFVDKVVVSVDEASTDNTKEVAERLADEVFSHKWENDFGKARESLQRRITTDWVLWLDGHEYVSKCPDLSEFLKLDVEGFMTQIQMEDGFKFWFARILRKNIHWERAVHNNPKCKSSKVLKDFLIVHDRVDGQEKDAIKTRLEQRNSMNFDKLKKDLRDDKKNVRSTFYLAQQYRLSADWKNGIKYYKKYLKISKTTQERWIACYEGAKCAIFGGKYFKAIKFCQQAEKELPKRWEISKLFGIVFMLLQEWETALQWLVESFTINKGTFLFEPEQRNNARVWFLIGQCFLSLNNKTKAESAWQRALNIHKDSASEKLNIEEEEIINQLLGKKEEPKIQVKTAEVCLVVFQRHARVPKILEQLKNQTVQNFRVNIWNNSGKKLDVSNFPSERIQVINSEENIGSQARFRIIPKTTGNPIIFIDDDLELETDFVEYNIKEFKRFGPNCILGWFTRTFTDENYWRTNRKASYGHEVDYIGTGGMVLDREIFDKYDVFQTVPEKYKKVEDLFLCYMARKILNKKLIAILPKCKILVDQKDQYQKLIDYKQIAFEALRKSGWKLLKDKESK